MTAAPDALAQIARAIVPAVVDATLRGAVLILAMGALFAVLRRKPVAARLQAWTMVLCAAVSLPLLSVVMPAWQWPLPAIPVLADWQPAASSSPGPSSPAPSISSIGTTVATASPDANASWALTGPTIVTAIYLAGVLLLLAQAALGWLVTRRLRRSATAITESDALARLARQSAYAGLARAPLLMESARVFVPVTLSVLRPVVMLPADWREWPADRLDAVLAHEIAHVARRDALTQRVSLFYRAVLWCSPLSWWLHRQLADLAEQASDEAALGAGTDPATYAETLLGFFTRLRRDPRRAAWLIAMARGADAEASRRVERILSWKGSPIMTGSRWWLTAMALATAPVVALTASIQPTTSRAPSVAAPLAIAAAGVDAVVPQAPPPPPPAAAKPAQKATSKQMPPPPPPPPRPAAKPAPPPPPPPPPPDATQTTGLVEDDFAKGAYAVGTPDVVAPTLLRSVEPKYTPNAMRAKIQGFVEVEMIVMPDGTVGKVRVKESLDPIHGLDEQALIAVKAWRFSPGTFQGQPVPVHVVGSLQFRLH